MRNKIIICLVLSLLAPSLFGQNLLDMSDWTVGTGSTSGFGQNGATSENTREWGIGPHGERAILWKGSPDGSYHGDGGWNGATFAIDHTKMYRYAVWIKKTNSTDGTTYFGCYGGTGSVTTLSGGPHSNPYFWAGDLPELDKWFLLVGYIHGSGDNSTTSYGRIYDGVTGKALWNFSDFKFQTSATIAVHRTYLFYDYNTSDRQYFYAPRVDEVNGNEPSIAELLGILPTALDQLTVGTDDLPSGYKLSVGGEAIMEKVKVQLETAWPDYVFNKDYSLKSLNELKAFIEKNGHLPNIPSAEEISKSNQDLGLIQQKLLEKIEELTLYAIAADKEKEELKAQNSKLESQYAVLSTQYNSLNTQFERLLKRIEKLESGNNDKK